MSSSLLSTYALTQYQQKLIYQSPHISITQLSVLQRNTMTRLQFIVHNRKNFIKSIQDQYQHLRIFILSLLTKIFQSYSQLNNKRLLKFKQIIYSSNLQHIIKDYGLLKEQLHKLVAVQLNKMQVGFQAQSYLLNMFNCVHFFDLILMTSFQEYLLTTIKQSDLLQKQQQQNQHNQQQGQCEINRIERLFQQEFDLSIVWDRQHSDHNQSNLNDNHNNNQLHLYKQQNNNKIMCQSKLNMTFIGESSQQSSLNGSLRGSINKNKKRSKSKTNIMLQTISVNQSKSPYQFTSTYKKNKQQLMLNNFDHNNNNNRKPINNNVYEQNEDNSLNDNNDAPHVIKPQLTKKKRTLWDVICCTSQQ